MEFLISHVGASVHARDIWGNEPLHLAIRYGDGDSIPPLLLAGAGINARDHDDHTPLNRACGQGLFEAVKVLASCDGVDLNAMNRKGHTPLIASIISPRYDRRILQHLAQQGVDLDYLVCDKRTAAHFACLYRNKDARQQLLRRHADFTLVDAWGYTPESIHEQMLAIAKHEHVSHR